VFRGESEAPRSLYVMERPAGGAGCAPTPSTDSGSELINVRVNGGFRTEYLRRYETGGSYSYCTWLVEDSNDTQSVGGVRRFVVRVR
jgi:hypothetical protein